MYFNQYLIVQAIEEHMETRSAETQKARKSFNIANEGTTTNSHDEFVRISDT